MSGIDTLFVGLIFDNLNAIVHEILGLVKPYSIVSNDRIYFDFDMLVDCLSFIIIVSSI